MNDDDDDDDDDEAGAGAPGIPTPEQLKSGIAVLAARKGVLEEAVVVSPSKKKEGHWAVRFTSDGKLIPKPIEELRIPADDDDDDDDDDDNDDDGDDDDDDADAMGDDDDDDDNDDDDDDDDDEAGAGEP